MSTHRATTIQIHRRGQWIDAAMYLDDETIVRGCHWRGANGRIQDTWLQVVEGLDVEDEERKLIAEALFLIRHDGCSPARDGS